VSIGDIVEIVIWNSGTQEEISMDSGKKRGVINQTPILTRERICSAGDCFRRLGLFSLLWTD
jgi:hypothetical protein